MLCRSVWSWRFAFSNLNKIKCTASLHSNAPVRLELVGRLEDKKDDNDTTLFAPGQSFLHKLFGYRGTVLASWNAHLYDKNSMSHKFKKGQQMTEPAIYYLVLIDKRDTGNLPYLAHGITFLSEERENLDHVFEISGLDYVPHADILPYKVMLDDARHDKDALSIFFNSDPNSRLKCQRSERLQAWLDQKSEALAVTTVHRETTDGIRITVLPFFLGNITAKTSPNEQWRYWRYTIRIENLLDRRVQLVERFWKIFSVSGCLESIKGNGVVGMQPILDRNNPVFQYSSHTHLKAPWGHMWGSLRFQCEDGGSIDAKVPAFPLCSPQQSNTGLPPSNFIVK